MVEFILERVVVEADLLAGRDRPQRTHLDLPAGRPDLHATVGLTAVVHEHHHAIGQDVGVDIHLHRVTRPPGRLLAPGLEHRLTRDDAADRHDRPAEAAVPHFHWLAWCRHAFVGIPHDEPCHLIEQRLAHPAAVAFCQPRHCLVHGVWLKQHEIAQLRRVEHQRRSLAPCASGLDGRGAIRPHASLDAPRDHRRDLAWLAATDVGVFVDHDAIERGGEQFALLEQVLVASVACRRVDGRPPDMGQRADRGANLFE